MSQFMYRVLAWDHCPCGQQRRSPDGGTCGTGNIGAIGGIDGSFHRADHL